MPPTPAKLSCYCDWHRFDIASFVDMLRHSDLDVFNPTSNIDQLWSEWYSKFMHALDICALLKLKRERRKKCKWMNDELLSLIHERKRLYRKWKGGHFNDVSIFSLYKRVRNASNNLYRKLKNEFYQTCCPEYSKNPTRLWRVIRDVTGGRRAQYAPSIPTSELSTYFASLA